MENLPLKDLEQNGKKELYQNAKKELNQNAKKEWVSPVMQELNLNSGLGRKVFESGSYRKS